MHSSEILHPCTEPTSGGGANDNILVDKNTRRIGGSLTLAMTDHSHAICQICGTPIGSDPVTICPKCETVHHQDCWKYLGETCSTFGCDVSWISCQSLVSKVSVAALPSPPTEALTRADQHWKASPSLLWFSREGEAISLAKGEKGVEIPEELGQRIKCHAEETSEAQGFTAFVAVLFFLIGLTVVTTVTLGLAYLLFGFSAAIVTLLVLTVSEALLILPLLNPATNWWLVHSPSGEVMLRKSRTLSQLLRLDASSQSRSLDMPVRVILVPGFDSHGEDGGSGVIRYTCSLKIGAMAYPLTPPTRQGPEQNRRKMATQLQELRVLGRTTAAYLGVPYEESLGLPVRK